MTEQPATAAGRTPQAALLREVFRDEPGTLYMIDMALAEARQQGAQQEREAAWQRVNEWAARYGWRHLDSVKLRYAILDAGAKEDAGVLDVVGDA